MLEARRFSNKRNQDIFVSETILFSCLLMKLNAAVAARRPCRNHRKASVKEWIFSFPGMLREKVSGSERAWAEGKEVMLCRVRNRGCSTSKLT